MAAVLNRPSRVTRRLPRSTPMPSSMSATGAKPPLLPDSTVMNSSRARGTTAQRGMARLRRMWVANKATERASAAPRMRWASAPIGQSAAARANSPLANPWRRIGRKCPASASPNGRARRRRRGAAIWAMPSAIRKRMAASVSAIRGWTIAGLPGSKASRRGKPWFIPGPCGSGRDRRRGRR